LASELPIQPQRREKERWRKSSQLRKVARSWVMKRISKIVSRMAIVVKEVGVKETGRRVVC